MRLKQRLPCELHHGPHQTAGLILDVSARGLFVRASSGTWSREPGMEVRVVLKPVGREPFELMARLARSRRVRRELARVVEGGLGLEGTSAPEEFYRLVRSLG